MTVCAAVRGHGIGVDPAAPARIFERFERTVPAHRDEDLAVGAGPPAESIEGAGGTIQERARLGAGSTLVAEWPCFAERIE